MKMNDFFFDLPQELIAQNPTENRGESRLLVLNRETGKLEHTDVSKILDFIPDNTLLVFNNTRVRKARIYGKSDTGGTVEFLLTKKLDDTSTRWEAIAKKAKKQRPGKKLYFPEDVECTVAGDLADSHKELLFSAPVTDDYLDRCGHIPLPPYIKRDDTASDAERYQTVYSEKTGSVAAPTAGLHFTDQLIDRIRTEGASRGISIAYVTLHVGLGTFASVRTENLLEHTMHTEEYEVTPETAAEINRRKELGHNVMAVGTTSVRTLESAFKDGSVQPGTSATNLFIYPGYKFNVVNRMFTNFHTPDSTLIVLVSAFAGTENIKKAYTEAVEQKYRFFSYGDAMLIL